MIGSVSMISGMIRLVFVLIFSVLSRFMVVSVKLMRYEFLFRMMWLGLKL